jgi:hypothetical protein
MTMSVAAALLALPAVHAQRIEKRREAQQARIAQGVKSGELTARETAKLEAKEAKLNRAIRKDRRDGGGLTAKERVKIEKAQDKMSRDIYRQKHDRQDR